MLNSVAMFMAGKREKKLGVKYTKMDALLFILSILAEMAIGVMGIIKLEISLILLSFIIPLIAMFIVVVFAAWRRIEELQR